MPSPDTFRRVLSRLKPDELTQCFANWTETLPESLDGEIVAIDGKTLRRSFDHAASKGAIHMVSAWANASRLVLGQLQGDDKSNEITAIPELLRMLEWQGAIVTLDAMGCPKEMARAMVEQGADYVSWPLKTTMRRFMERCNGISMTSRPIDWITSAMIITALSMPTMVGWKRATIGSPRISSA